MRRLMERIFCTKCKTNSWPIENVPEAKYDSWICQTCWYLAKERSDQEKQRDWREPREHQTQK